MGSSDGKRIRWPFVVVAAAVFLVMLAASLATPPGEELLRRIAVSRLRSATGLEVSIERIETDLRSRLVVDEIVLRRFGDAPGADALLSIGRADVSFRFRPLLRGRLDFRRIGIDSLRADLDRADIEPFLPAGPAGGGAAPGPPRVRFDTVTVEGIAARYRDGNLALSLQSPGLTVSAKADGGLDASIVATVSAHRGAGAVAVGVRVTGLRADIGTAPGGYRFTVAADTIVAAESDRSAALVSITADALLSAGDLAFRATAASGQAAGFHFGGLLAAGRIADGVAVVDSFGVAILDGRVEGSGRITADRSLDARLRLRSVALDPIRRLAGVFPGAESRWNASGGLIDGTLALAGRIDSLETIDVDASVTVAGVRMGGRPVPMAVLEAHLGGGRGSLQLRQERAEVAAEGSFARGNVSVDASADVPSIAPFAALAGFGGVDGRLRLRGTIRGNPASPAVDIALEGSGIDARGFPADTVAAAATIRGNAARLTRFFAAAAIDSLGTVPSAGDAGLSGSLRYEVRASGTPDSISAVFDVSLGRPALRGIALDTIDATGRYAGGAVEIERLSIGRDSLQAAGTGSFDRATGAGRLFLALLVHGEGDAPGRLAGDMEASARIDSTGLPLSGAIRAEGLDLALAAPLLPTGLAAAGSFSCDLDWVAARPAPGARGTVSVRGRIDAAAGGTRAIDSLAADLDVADASITVRRLSGRMRNVPVSATGGIVFAPEKRFLVDLAVVAAGAPAAACRGLVGRDTLSIELESPRLDVAVFSPLLPVPVDSGRVEARLRIGGRPGDPLVDGDLAVDGLSFRPSADIAVSGGRLRAGFDGRRVRIDTLVAGINGGRVSAAGVVEHRGGIPELIDLRAEAAGIEWNRQAVGRLSVVSADLACRPAGDGHRLSGEIVIGESRFVKALPPREIVAAARARRGAPPADRPDIIEKTAIEVRIRTGGDIWIDNNLARVRLSPNVSVGGTLARPVVTGRVNVDEGYVLFLDRRFRLERGTADFADPSRTNPILDVAARTRVTSYRGAEPTAYDVSIVIEGPLDEASFSLVSDPVLDRPDIVSLLTLGATRSELTGESGGVRGALAARAREVTSARVSNYLSNQLEGFLGLGTVTIEGDLFDFGKQWGPQLVASRQLTGRTVLTYRTNVGHMNENSIRLEYRLTRRFSLEGETDQAGSAGVDLKYRIRKR